MTFIEMVPLSHPHPCYGVLAIRQHYGVDDDWFEIDRADPRVLLPDKLVKAGLEPRWSWGFRHVQTCACDADLCWVHLEGSLLKFTDVNERTAVYRLIGKLVDVNCWVAVWPD